MEETFLSTQVLEPGNVLAGRYEIVRQIAVGGMATVYLARDLKSNGEEVALKDLHREFTENRDHVERFLREVKLTNGISHPNIVRSFDVGTDGGHIYYTMEYVPGTTLEDLMENKKFSNQEIGELVIQICQGLCAIHERGIIHRDLKPGNVLMGEDGMARIADFGVARPKWSRLTQPNQVVGSLCYMAPEMWIGKRVGQPADFYALGIMLYELVTGKVPFDSPLPGEMLDFHARGQIEPPWKTNSSSPMWLNDLIMRLVAKQPKDRPRSAQAIVDYVEREAIGGKPKSGVFPSVQLADLAAASGTSRHNLPAWSEEGVSALALDNVKSRRKTYVFKLRATSLMEDAASGPSTTGETTKIERRRKATVVIPLPHRAAMVLELERPSRDVIYFGVFLASLQIMDGLLTTLGVGTFGVQKEGNPLLRNLMMHIGVQNTMLLTKFLGIVAVGIMTIAAKRSRLFTDIIGALSCVYLFAAIVPWVFILYSHYLG